MVHTLYSMNCYSVSFFKMEEKHFFKHQLYVLHTPSLQRQHVPTPSEITNSCIKVATNKYRNFFRLTVQPIYCEKLNIPLKKICAFFLIKLIKRVYLTWYFKERSGEKIQTIKMTVIARGRKRTNTCLELEAAVSKWGCATSFKHLTCQSS